MPRRDSNHNPSTQAAADPRIRPRGHRDRRIGHNTVQNPGLLA